MLEVHQENMFEIERQQKKTFEKRIFVAIVHQSSETPCLTYWKFGRKAEEEIPWENIHSKLKKKPNYTRHHSKNAMINKKYTSIQNKKQVPM